MMSLTPEEADEQLRQAIIAHAEAYDIANSETEMVSDYAIIASWQPMTDTGNTRYTTHYVRPHLPLHTITGLFETALHLVWDEDEED